jgi:hypothetical protein
MAATWSAPGGVTFDLRKFPKDDFERFRKAVLEGKPMPAWRDKISDDDVKLLWAYVRSGGLDTTVSARAGWILKWTERGLYRRFSIIMLCYLRLYSSLAHV